MENLIKYGLIKEVNFKIVLLQKWLKDNDIEMCSIHDEEKSVVAERFIRTLKTKIYKYMTSVSNNVYINRFGDKEVNEKYPEFKVGDHVRISKYKNFFAKGYKPNWSEEVFVISKIKNIVPY